MKIGIIRESKTPPDSRVCLPPLHCREILDTYPNIQIFVQSSESRCYTDQEYLDLGIPVVEDVSDCDILLGVKEVKIDNLLANKTYFFFSHTIKKQAYNRKLLQTILTKKIRMVDYETLTDADGKRVIAFGRWAGIVGAHNGLITWGKRTKRYDLKSMNQCFDFEEAISYYPNLNLRDLKIVLTGTGRVSSGSAEVLDLMKIKKLTATEFLNYEGQAPVYCMLATEEMFARGANNDFDSGFYKDPSGYHSLLKPYLSKGNVLINGIYWDSKAPSLFTKKEAKAADFNIEVIADITCDIAPIASIPCTLRATTIAEPFFAYDPISETEIRPFSGKGIDMMTIDNLPNELPRDASADFGRQFITHVLPELFENKIDMIHRASITTKEGTLNEPYLYLSDYVGLEQNNK